MIRILCMLLGHRWRGGLRPGGQGPVAIRCERCGDHYGRVTRS